MDVEAADPRVAAAPSLLLTPKETVDVLCDFLEVALHTITVERGIYPKQIYERREKYGIPVLMSRHPGLNSYIRESIDSMKEWLMQHAVQRFVVVITGPQAMGVIERFVFEFHPSLVQVPKAWKELEEHFRGCILRIGVYDGPYKEVPLGAISDIPRARSTFHIEVLKRGGNDKITAWIAAERAAMGEYEITPLKAMDAGTTKLQLLVESALPPPPPPPSSPAPK